MYYNCVCSIGPKFELPHAGQGHPSHWYHIRPVMNLGRGSPAPGLVLFSDTWRIYNGKIALEM